jgi:hypothetical protein
LSVAPEISPTGTRMVCVSNHRRLSFNSSNARLRVTSKVFDCQLSYHCAYRRLLRVIEPKALKPSLRTALLFAGGLYSDDNFNRLFGGRVEVRLVVTREQLVSLPL